MSGHVAIQAAARAAAAQLLRDYAAYAGIRLQVYPARPLSVNPPTAFVDRMAERVDAFGPANQQRQPVVSVVVLHGLFDGKDTAAQRDAFVDGFLVWVLDRVHAAGANTTIGVSSVSDDPTFIPDWVEPSAQKTYYATTISLEVLAFD